MSLSNNTTKLQDILEVVNSLPDAVSVDDGLSETSTNPVQNKVITAALKDKAPTDHIHSYNDLIDKPTVISGKDGKSAYQFAVEGGYTGTEAEFAQKMATECLPLTGGTVDGDVIVRALELHELALKDNNGDGLVVEIEGNGRIRLMDTDGDAPCLLSGIKTPESDNDAANKEYVDNAIAPLVGTSTTLTPTQVYNAIQTGRSVLLTVPVGDARDTIQFSSFCVNTRQDRAEGIFSYMVDDNGQRFNLWGDLVANDWTLAEHGSVIADSTLSTTSTNPVQNKVITQMLTSLQETWPGVQQLSCTGNLDGTNSVVASGAVGYDLYVVMAEMGGTNQSYVSSVIPAAMVTPQGTTTPSYTFSVNDCNSAKRFTASFDAYGALVLKATGYVGSGVTTATPLVYGVKLGAVPDGSGVKY